MPNMGCPVPPCPSSTWVSSGRVEINPSLSPGFPETKLPPSAQSSSLMLDTPSAHPVPHPPSPDVPAHAQVYVPPQPLSSPQRAWIFRGLRPTLSLSWDPCALSGSLARSDLLLMREALAAASLLWPSALVRAPFPAWMAIPIFLFLQLHCRFFREAFLALLASIAHQSPSHSTSGSLLNRRLPESGAPSAPALGSPGVNRG